MVLGEWLIGSYELESLERVEFPFSRSQIQPNSTDVILWICEDKSFLPGMNQPFRAFKSEQTRTALMFTISRGSLALPLAAGRNPPALKWTARLHT